MTDGFDYVAIRRTILGLDERGGLQDSGLTAYEKLVAIALVEHMPLAYPSIARLVKITSLSRATILRTLRSLESKGVIRVQRTPGDNSLYTFSTGLPQRPVAPSDQSPRATTPVSPSDTTGLPQRPKEGN